MKDKDKAALDSLRAIKSQILLVKTESKGVEVTPEQEIAILQRMVKQREKILTSSLLHKTETIWQRWRSLK